MAHALLFRLAPDQLRAREAAERLFAEVTVELARVLPVPAEVLHVGATVIPGCLTKGDLDVVVRVAGSDFRAAEAELATQFPRNMGSIRTEGFAAFEDETRTPHLGIQLTAKGGAFDIFHRFAAALHSDVELLRRYNALKRAHDGQAMDRYRAAKDAFVTQVLRVADDR